MGINYRQYGMFEPCVSLDVVLWVPNLNNTSLLVQQNLVVNKIVVAFPSNLTEPQAKTNCDVIKQNQSEVGKIDFKIEPNKAGNVFCFLLLLASFNCSYLWNHLTNFIGVFCKM